MMPPEVCKKTDRCTREARHEGPCHSQPVLRVQTLPWGWSYGKHATGDLPSPPYPNPPNNFRG